MSTAEQARPRSYGNILKPRSAGLWHLGLLSTGMALGLFLVDVVVMFVAGVIPGIAAVLVTIPAVFLLLRPDVHGRTGAAKLTEATAGRVSGRKAGYRSGPTSLDPHGQHRLPGILGSSVLSEAEDAFGRRFAVLTYPWVGHLTVVLETEPDGSGAD